MNKNRKLINAFLVSTMMLSNVAPVAFAASGDSVIQRLGGDTRVETSVEVSNTAYTSAENVVIAGYSGEADALTGTLLAAAKDAPLLLVSNKADDIKEVKAELVKLGAKNVYLLGGESVISADLAAEFSEYNVTRVSGDDRFDTAAEVAETVGGEKDHVFLANDGRSGSLADALAAGPVSGDREMPVLLTSKSEVPAATLDAMKDLGASKVTLVGGESAISAAVVKQLEDAGYTVDRVDGDTRWETAEKIATKYFEDNEKVIIANDGRSTGKTEVYADALMGGYLGAKEYAPILLSVPGTLNDTTKNYLNKNASFAYVLGGETAISKAVYNEVEEILAGKVEDEVDLTVESVSAINKTTVKVAFNQPVDKVEKENFTIEGGNVVSATLSEDKMAATLDVTGLAYDTEYTVVIKDVVVNTAVAPEISAKFTTPAVASLWNLEVIPAAGSIEADGTDNTTVTFQLVDKVTGEVDKNANDIVLDLNTTYGSLAQKRATIQNGQATVVLRSEFNAKGVTAKIEAQIIEASGDYTDLIGQVAGSANVVFAAPGTAQVDATYLTAANTNEADRVTLTFDQEVSVADFVQTDVNGKLKNALQSAAGGNGNSVTIKQGEKMLAVKGFLPGATKNSLIAVLDVDRTAMAKSVLTDNSDVQVAVSMLNTANKITDSEQEFKFTDARVPQVTSVNAVGMKEVVVKFSEPIAQANFLIDGRYDTTGFDISYGEFAFDTNSKQFVDNRNVVTLKLNEDYKEVEKLAGYFKAGKHALQISSIADFAALSDKNNIGSTQNLEFNVAENKDLAKATVIVDSPNQYRVAFDKEAEVNADDITLQVYNTDSKKWENVVENAYFANELVASDVEVTKITGDTAIDQYKVEVNKAWTTVYDTAATKNNYYNDKFRVVIAEEALKTTVNGKVNPSAIVLSLNDAKSPMNTPDTTSPVISEIQETTVPGTYLVTMSEPVTGDLANEVEFIGKDKDGKVRTFEGVPADYYYDGLDNKFFVKAVDYSAIEKLVKDGGSEDWTLVLKDVTDDIGNKAATVTKDFKIKVAEEETVETAFKVEEVTGTMVDGEKITVKFTKDVALTGKGSAIDTANFTLNGSDLPTGTSIKLGADNKTVVISLKEGTLQAGSQVLTLGKNLEAKDGTELTGAYAFTFDVEAVN